MKILLLGKNGQVGWELQRALAPLGELTALDFDTPDPWRADFSQPDTLLALLQKIQPELIVNAAAHTAVDKAESEPALARCINASAPGVLARWAAEHGAWLAHYSTDYVFNGSGDAPRAEDAITAPLNVYGQTKLEGEELIRASGCQHLIFRTSWVYAARGGNFARTMLRLAAERDVLNVIDDQVGAPTGADWLADITAHAVCAAVNRPTLAGTYHAVAAGHTSWHGYASLVIDWARRHGQAIRVPAHAIHAVATAAFPTAAQRPLNSRLDTGKLKQNFGLQAPPWQAGVERMLAEVLGC